VEEGTIAGDRAMDALPPIVAWLQGDPDYPRGAFQPIYSMLLTMFAIGSRRGRPIYESTGLLAKAGLSVGLATNAYKELLGDVSELMGSGLGADAVYWLLDIVEETLRFPSSGGRSAFVLLAFGAGEDRTAAKQIERAATGLVGGISRYPRLVDRNRRRDRLDRFPRTAPASSPPV
jgi:hypothetical protein